MNKIEKIKAEIERRKNIHENTAKYAEESGQEECRTINTCEANLCENLLAFIESLKKEQPKKLDVTDFCKPIPEEIAKVMPDVVSECLLGDGKKEPQGLNEAAKDYATIKVTHTHGEIRSVEKYEAFKAGAEWMTRQALWSRELKVKEDSSGCPYIDKRIELYDYGADEPLAKEGDKVIVQIRKAE